MSQSIVLADAIRDAADPALVMRRVAQQAIALIPTADGSSIEVYIGGSHLEYACGEGSLAPFVGLRLDIGRSLSGRAVLTGELLRCDDSSTDDRVDRAACERTGVRSMLCLPLTDDRSRVAVLKVSSRQTYAFSRRDEMALQRLGEFLRVALGAAAELARVTAMVLDQDGSSPSVDEAVHRARFVANVMRPGLVEDVNAARRIRGVLDDGLMSVLVQPIVDLRDSTVTSAEALTRFPSVPPRGPDAWFAEAHAVGLGVELELVAVTKALGLLRHLPDDVRLCVNVGPRALSSPDLLRLLGSVPGHRVTLELTEHVQVDYHTIAGPLRQLGDLGVALAIDDTGTGYSSLSHILQLRPQVIKLDRELTRGIDADVVRQALATALVHFATRDLSATVVAEGIESAAEAETLLGLGIHFGQGFYLHRPTQVDAVAW